jgi:hypothetical protein
MLKAKIGVGLLMMVLAAVVVAGAETAAPAAPAGGGGFAGAGGGRRGGNMDPAAMREAIMQRMKEQLAATDQEWTVMEPKLTKVMDLSRELQAARGGALALGGRGGRGGRGGAPAAAPTTPQTDVGKARAALQTALDDAGAKPEVIKQQLAALREAKAKVRQDLDKATADLKSVLSARQEAVLLMGGILD